jgi:hypothetical protein
LTPVSGDDIFVSDEIVVTDGIIDTDQRLTP